MVIADLPRVWLDIAGMGIPWWQRDEYRSHAASLRVASPRHDQRKKREKHMSAVDKAKNKVEEMAGKAKEKVGEATGDRDTQAEGQKDQAKGNLKQAGEKVKDAFKN
jgi:uncharacterized protein YjbJ (UPF0337 family)